MSHPPPVPQKDGEKSAEKSEKADLMFDSPQQPELNSLEAADADSDDHIKRLAASGTAHFHRLGWKRLAVVTVVEAVALGALGLPRAYDALGMLLGVLLTIGLGLVAIFTSYLVGQVKLRHPDAASYPDAGRLLLGRAGYEIFGAAMVIELIMVVGSHALTGSIALADLLGPQRPVCSIVLSAISAIILLLLAIPPSFAEVAILGYVDFISIVAAIGVTVIATGIQAGKIPDGGLSAVDWRLYPRPGLGFAEAFVAVSNIVFAYSFAIGQFSFMDEMHTPSDYMKSIWSSGAVQILLYTLTGALCYAFVGQGVQAPALLSAGPVVSRVAFGLALPVIFISGSINTTVALRYVHGRMWRDSVVRYINTARGWLFWIALVTAFTFLAWVVAEAVPIFSDLLSLASALFVSGFSFWIPAVMWFCLLCEGGWFERRNLAISLGSIFAFIIGIIIFSDCQHRRSSSLYLPLFAICWRSLR